MSAWPSPTYAALSHSDAIASLIEHGRAWRGVVHSEFRSALNISTSNGLITVAPPAAGRLPNGVVADLGPDFRRLGVRAGMTVVGGSSGLAIDGAGVVIDLSGTSPWSPSLARPWGGAAASARRWRERAAATRGLAAAITRNRQDEGRGIGLLVEPDRPAADGREVDGRDVDGRREAGEPASVADRARPILGALGRSIRARDARAASRTARGLIGLGPGLTPSGDDALVGIAAACHALRSPVQGFLADALVDVDERTTAIAAAYLRHAGRGQFAERIHGLLDALLGRDPARIEPAIRAFVDWGATSGTDCLVGILLGLDAAADAEVAA